VIFLDKLSRFERARLLSARALQLALGAPPLVKVQKERTMYELSKREFEEKVLPLTVYRTFPNGTKKVIEWN
jgi:DNA-directed RNA polymerase subunit K/omega